MPFDPNDPRAGLASVASVDRGPASDDFAGAEYARFYSSQPQETSALDRTWYAGGQNFLVAFSDASLGAVFERSSQVDEYAVLLPDAGSRLEVDAGSGAAVVPGRSLAFVPAGASTVRVTSGGRVVRLFTTRSSDLAALCSNAESYREPHANVAVLSEPWPEPVGGFRVRVYSLDVPPEPGRFGRIWRCTTLMVNYLDPQEGPRDVTKMSPHNHQDFEQCSLALEGEFMHHIRWPWTPDMRKWRADDHELCGSPSVTVIPPPAIHTTNGVGAGTNQLVDIFCPPRVDFSEKPGWVLNAAEYPMPA